MDLKQEIRDFSYETAYGDKNLIFLQLVCEVQVSRISFFTVSSVFEKLMCN